MTALHDRRFPNESAEYREARDALLRAEMGLRRQIEEVAALRRSLPPGGAPPEDYRFAEGASDLADESGAREVRLSELFEAGKDTLLLYSFMYPPDGKPCPACTAFLDGFDANARHLGEVVNVAVVARSPLPRLRRWARSRGWRNLRLLSSHGNAYNADYHAETADGAQWPLMNVFVKDDAGVRHRYCSELFFAPEDEGQHPRHLDLLWPLWNALDLTPGGRPADWFPMRSYEQSLAECGEE